jgi:hypothetical protein
VLLAIITVARSRPDTDERGLDHDDDDSIGGRAEESRRALSQSTLTYCTLSFVQHVESQPVHCSRRPSLSLSSSLQLIVASCLNQT